MELPRLLNGQRIQLQPMDLNHLEELYVCGNNSEIWTYLPNRMDTKEDMKNFIESALEDKTTGLEYPFVVYDKTLSKLVGSTRFLNISVPNKNLEIGYTWYSQEVWRTQVNTECKYLLMKHCFEEMEAVRVQLKADVRNIRSNIAIERIGAVKEGVLRQDRILPDGHYRSANIYSIIHTEWPMIKSRLEGYLRA